jgi:hypothetical protein
LSAVRILPSRPVPILVLKGKSVLAMPVNSEIDTCNTQTQDFAALGAQLGLHVHVFADSGVPTQWVTGVQDATSAHDAAVALICGIMVQFALPAIEGVHRAGLKIHTWGASRSVESLMLKSDSLVAADPGPDERWDAYEAMDQVIRLVGHHAAASVSAEIDPNRFWVPSNVPAFFGPGGTYGDQGYGGDTFINGFRTLWGLSPAGS